METIFDIPAHPLFVHAPIVLLPLLAIVALVAALRPGLARRLGWWLPLGALAVFVMLILAMQSGEALNDAIKDDIGNVAAKHQDLAETTRLLAFAMLASTAALWWVTRRAFGPRPARSVGAASAEPTTGRSPIVLGVAALVVVFSALSTVWIVRTGHEGARIHWNGVIKGT